MEKTIQGIGLKNIHKTKNYFDEKIQENKQMSRKHKNVCVTQNYTEYFLILAFAVTGCIEILLLLL